MSDAEEGVGEYKKMDCTLGLKLHLNKIKQGTRKQVLNQRTWRSHVIPMIEQKKFNQRLQRKLNQNNKSTSA